MSDPVREPTDDSYVPGPPDAVHADDVIAHGNRWRRERDEYRQAALELNAEIRYGLAWVAAGAEPSVALHHMLTVADKWRALLEDAPDNA
jgi:hypothetical protein